MFPSLDRSEDETADSGAETAESDCSRMSSSGSELTTGPPPPPPPVPAHRVSLHLLADPGASVLLQQTLDLLTGRLYPSLSLFHVSERSSSIRSPGGACPPAGYPSLSVTFFLHEAYGEERILRVLERLQRPPWRYHHTESCGWRPAGTPGGLIRPYLLPSRDFYSLGPGMPVWGVRPVHCGGEILRLTLYTGHDNYEDAVHFYETVLQRPAEEQKTGFCWFTLHCEPGLCLQLALKQLSPGVRSRPCGSAVLQFLVEEMGQLVPLLPNPCSPISRTRWQTEDLDGNKVLFQVKPPAQPERPLTCAFPPACPGTSSSGTQPRSSAQGHVFLPPTHRQGGHQPHTVPPLDRFRGGAASLESGSCSSQNSSPAPFSAPSLTRSLSHLLLEEDKEETNVDTGVPAAVPAPALALARSASSDLLSARGPRSPSVLVERFPQMHLDLQGPSRTCVSVSKEDGRPGEAAGLRPGTRTVAELLSARMYRYEPVDEFFI